VPPVCTICKHPKRKAIDKAITSGASVRNIAARFSIAQTSLQRHKAHIKRAIIKARDKGQISTGKTVFEQFSEMWETAIEEYKKAASSGEKAMWFRERRGLFEMGAKLGMQSQQERFQYRGCDPAILAVMEKYRASK
jgi:hypothetical protein